MRADPAFAGVWLRKLAALAVALAAALALGAWLSFLAGASPRAAITALVAGAVGSPFAWSGALLRTAPILLTGLAVAWAFRAGLFNIGAEGQLLWGALAAAWVGRVAPLPAVLHIPLALAAGAAAGAAWAWPAAWLKARRRAPEVLTTLLLSFVAVHLTTYLASHPLHDPAQQGPRTADIAATAFLPTLPASRLHAGLPLGFAVALLLAGCLRNARGGFQLRIVGQNPDAARAAGLSVERTWTQALLCSGALAGLAGAVEILGVHHYFQAGFSPGYGYEGIAVAILGGGAPVGVAAAALFWGALANGAVEMELSAGVNRSLVTVIQALVVLAAAVRAWPFSPRRGGRSRHTRSHAGGPGDGAGASR